MYSTMGNSLSTVLEIINNLRSEYTIDSTRLYVTGLSMGGFGTWDLIMRKPDMFAAAIPICGGGDTTYANTIAHIPLRVFHSSDDPTITVKYSRDMDIALLKTETDDYLYTEYDGLGHESWETAYIEPWLSTWMFSKRKYFYDDEEPPSKPTGLNADNVSQTEFTLYWDSSIDNIDVSLYRVYVNGELYYVGSDTSATILGLTQETTYSVIVYAIDENDNISEASDELQVTTLSSADILAPSVPEGLLIPRVGQTNFTVQWPPSTDNVGVVAYDIYLNGELYVSSDTTECLVTGLTVGTNYSVSISARDRVNNVSAKSTEVPVTTLSSCNETINWTNTRFSEPVNDIVTVGFDVTPDGDNMNGLVGLSCGDVVSYSGYSCIVRFYTDGIVDAYNLGSTTGYAAENEFLYYAGETYHVRMVVDITANQYDAYISREGEPEVTIATDYNFRASAASLNNYAIYTLECTLSVENFSITEGISNAIGLNENICNYIVYPNPASTVIYLNSAADLVNIYNLSGHLVKSVRYNVEKINIEDIKKGIYLVEIYNNQRVFDRLIVD